MLFSVKFGVVAFKKCYLEKFNSAIKPSVSRPQAASLSSPTPGWRTAPSSSATTASATCAATRAPRSCRSRARATSCTGPTPSGWPSPRWPRPCWARRRGEWRSTSTAKTVGGASGTRARSRVCAGAGAVRGWSLLDNVRPTRLRFSPVLASSVAAERCLFFFSFFFW